MTQTENFQDDLQIPSRLETLKQRATAMGIRYSPNIGEEALSAKINEALDKTVNADSEAAQAQKSEAALREELLKEALLLKRVIVRPVCPRRAQLQGELVFTGNKIIGVLGKYVPYNVETGYYVPNMHLKHLEGSTFTQFYVYRDAHGNEETRSRQAKAFVIEYLPDLTQEEIDIIAARQKGTLQADEA